MQKMRKNLKKMMMTSMFESTVYCMNHDWFVPMIVYFVENLMPIK